MSITQFLHIAFLSSEIEGITKFCPVLTSNKFFYLEEYDSILQQEQNTLACKIT